MSASRFPPSLLSPPMTFLKSVSVFLFLSSSVFPTPAMSAFEKDSSKTSSSRRKALETSLNSSSSNRLSSLVNSKKFKTPTKGLRSPSSNGSSSHGTPSRGKAGGNKTPGDRFIPSRLGSDFDRSKYLLTELSPSKKERMSSVLGGETRILSYAAQSTPFSPFRTRQFPQTASGTSKKSTRHIPSVPERILDAPELLNDYYLNLLDWSSSNHLAVALGPQVFLWNASSGDIQALLSLPEDTPVTSLKWIKEGGNYLAVGTGASQVQLWDVEAAKRTRILSSHTDRVSCLSWNAYILSSGSRSGEIHHSDVRVASHHIASSNAHSQEVCGLAWSPNGRILASGANDNVLNLWEASGSGGLYARPEPCHSLTQHQAAVKALAWCPWQPHVLASGGGTADRCIKIWNANNGNLLNSVDTKSQYKELVSSHGFANNQVTIWKYPSMTKTAELLGHTERVLHMALSPMGPQSYLLGQMRRYASGNKKEASKAPAQTSNKLRANIR
ncbi:Cell division cycle protein 20 -like protein, partial [Caligus rogercresseyi]